MMRRTVLAAVAASALACAVAQAGGRRESQELVIPSAVWGEYFLIALEVDLDGDGQTTTLMALLIDPGCLRSRRHI